MIIRTTFKGTTYSVDLNMPIDISIPLQEGNNNPNCYYAPPVELSTIRSGDFIGSVKEGGSVNYQSISFTPHGNGTHTECYGHITPSGATINSCLQRFVFFAELISTNPVKLKNGDEIITAEAIRQARQYAGTEALIIRTLPNDPDKLTRKYSGTNPPYFEPEVMRWLKDQSVEHFLTDLPSIDREVDQGKLASHKAFWGTDDLRIRKNASITELIYVDNKIADGLYMLNIQIPAFEVDAAPSKPIIYKMLQQL